MEGWEPSCKYDSTWEEEEEAAAREEPRSWWIVRWIRGSFLLAWLVNFQKWIQWSCLKLIGGKNEERKETGRIHGYSKNKISSRQRNLRAAKDMQNYRHGYPDLDDEDEPDDMPNFNFYTNIMRFEPNGVFIDELLCKWYQDYNLLEQSHSYIQWLFPLRESGMNWHARPLSRKELQMFKKNKKVKERFVRAYKLMLDFYGIALMDEGTGELKRATNYVVRFRNLHWHSHNNLRITRILKCLGEMGYEHYQVKLVKFFLKETLVEGNLLSVQQSVLDYFLFTVRDKQQRQKLVHYAWKHYALKDQFVWGPHDILKRFKDEHEPKPTNHSVTDCATGRAVQETEGGGETTQLVAEEAATTQESDDSPLNSETEIGTSVDAPRLPVAGSADMISRAEQSQVVLSEEKEASMATQRPESKESEGRNAAEEASGNAMGSEVLEQDESERMEGRRQSAEALMGNSEVVKKRKLTGSEEEGNTETSLSPKSGGTAPKSLHDGSTNMQSTGDSNSENSTEQKGGEALVPATKKKKVDEEKPVSGRLEFETSQSNGPIQRPATEEGKVAVPPESNTECAEKEIAGAASEEDTPDNVSIGRDFALVDQRDSKPDFTEAKEKDKPTAAETRIVLEEKITTSPNSQQVIDLPHTGRAQESSTRKQDVQVGREAPVKAEDKEQARKDHADTLDDGTPQDGKLDTNNTQEQQQSRESPSHGSQGETKEPDQEQDLVTALSITKPEEDTAGHAAVLEGVSKMSCNDPQMAPLGEATNPSNVVQPDCDQDAKLGSSEISSARNEQKQDCDSSVHIPDRAGEAKVASAGIEGQATHYREELKSPTDQQDPKPEQDAAVDETPQGGGGEHESSREAEQTEEQGGASKHI